MNRIFRLVLLSLLFKLSLFNVSLANSPDISNYQDCVSSHFQRIVISAQQTDMIKTIGNVVDEATTSCNHIITNLDNKQTIAEETKKGMLVAIFNKITQMMQNDNRNQQP